MAQVNTLVTLAGVQILWQELNQRFNFITQVKVKYRHLLKSDLYTGRFKNSS